MTPDLVGKLYRYLERISVRLRQVLRRLRLRQGQRPGAWPHPRDERKRPCHCGRVRAGDTLHVGLKNTTLLVTPFVNETQSSVYQLVDPVI